MKTLGTLSLGGDPRLLRQPPARLAVGGRSLVAMAEALQSLRRRKPIPPQLGMKQCAAALAGQGLSPRLAPGQGLAQAMPARTMLGLLL